MAREAQQILTGIDFYVIELDGRTPATCSSRMWEAAITAERGLRGSVLKIQSGSGRDYLVPVRSGATGYFHGLSSLQYRYQLDDGRLRQLLVFFGLQT